MWGWLGRPIAVLSLGLFMAVLALVASVRLSGRRGPIVAVVALPLLLNLYWLLDPQIEPARGRFLFGASLWMAAATAVWITVPAGDRRWRWFGPLLIAVALFPVYLATMSRAVGAADTFEFQVVAPQLGIAHPTGYPLYLLLGKLFSLMPVGSVAMRLNAGSAVFAVLAAMLVFRAALRLLNSPLPALFGAVALGLTPVFWSQAIVAEVYTLNALVVSLALLLMVRLIDGRPAGRGQGRGSDRKTMVALAFVLGLGLTNHITAVFLLPPAALAVIFNLLPALRGRLSGVSRRRSLLLLSLQLAVAFALPLLLYAYLPVRWQAINGEPMGVGRFIEWVVGGRFQGALQWGAWLSDTTRRQVVGRLLVENWGRPYLLLAAASLVWLTVHSWRVALVFLVTAAGFQAGGGLHSLWVFGGLLAFVAFFALSLGPVMWVLVSEIFPNRVRALAISCVGLVNSSICFLGQLVFPWQMEHLGGARTFLIYAIFAVLGVVLMARILPETRGRSLEELEDLEAAPRQIPSAR